MTDTKPYFTSDKTERASTAKSAQTPLSSADAASSITTVKIANEVAHPTQPRDQISLTDTEAVTKFVVKAARPNSKLILQNMEEVLNSVKEKHRQKHRRKREQRKLAQMEAAAVAAAAGSTLEKSADSQVELEQNAQTSKPSKKHRKHSKTHPLKEKVVQENDQHKSNRCKSATRGNKSPLKTSANGDLLRHFPITPKKNESSSLDYSDKEIMRMGHAVEQTASVSGTPSKPQPSKKVNAFEVLMNARNKSIGSNTPGVEVSPTTSNGSPSVNAKRKLMLQEWADKKGAGKRKLDEESRAAYVDYQLENRAKRLKKMLVSGNSSKVGNIPSNETVNEHPSNKKLKKTNTASKGIHEKTKRVRRLKRLDSTESMKQEEETVNCLSIDVETAEFLSKLSSPTKKRDSLLGYFPRKESPNNPVAKIAQILQDEVANSPDHEITMCTPQKVTRRSGKNSTKVSNDVKLDESLVKSTKETVCLEIADKDLNTPSGRPKRSCAGKARYDYDWETSPTKQERSTAQHKKMTKSESLCELEIDVITLDDSSNLTPEKQPKKLAPLFLRSVPKPNPDPAVLKARQEFLMSSVPEKMRQDMEKQKQYEQNYEEIVQYFPLVAHVQQFSVEEQDFLKYNRESEVKLKLADNEDVETVQITRRAKGRSRGSIGNMPKQKKSSSKISEKRNDCTRKQPLQVPLKTVDNKRDVIKSWKTEFERFPTYKCYNQMREKYRYFSAIDSGQNMEQVNESFVVTRHTERVREIQNVENEDVKPPATAPNGELLFTEKYKPMLYEQVLVNLIPVSELREFLASWTNGTGGSARNSQTLDDTMDVANDSNSSLSAIYNTVVLLGPASSGKTNAVYALANDFNFNVLEINAGMKRTGKRLMQELQEATQSHQIRKDVTSTQAKTPKSLLRMSQNGQKKHKQNSQNNEGDSNSSSVELSQNARKCLILIEDADVVFEKMDAGFTDAIYTLAASSKRPVIIMATNPNCAHLQRFMAQNTIKFSSANSLNISRFMAVLSLIENCPINLDDLVSLYLYNSRDLRRTLLEVQFFIQSGGDRERIMEIITDKLQRTPEKSVGAGGKRENSFFASPTKRSLSVETLAQNLQENDEQLLRSKSSNGTNDIDTLYVHRTLFEFYTTNQNEAWRVPFPVDFSLLRLNLTDLLQGARLLKFQTIENTSETADQMCSVVDSGVVVKRKTRSPKKTWLNNATTSGDKESTSVKAYAQPFNILCNFYENLSIATLLDACSGERESKDRLQPHLGEYIAHELVERSITVELATPTFPYNLFDSPIERHSLCDYLSMPMRAQRTRALDYEPTLRAICRSEKQRAAQERRSTRFYHYLRYSAPNVSSFSTETFDRACEIMQDITSGNILEDITNSETTPNT